ncbi:GNAT family N-acetyltransferase [Halobaculum sp. CBA1158]|uniref:GNAT family N-acetyltransferase n=1 Tax=Halobaculum sp. CBA1158 TaxID=2904243 RepID=UPI001F301B8E|nr:GNAT family N-acetyltransferase [Halobaculum sp. CBA1158]UIO98821.1 GNAT family N-acetyltransferase [Halobaculum sp. CBA1158]
MTGGFEDPGERAGDEAVAVREGEMDDADAVADLWVALAEGQRIHGTTLRGEENRAAAREAAARAVVTGGLFVAHVAGDVAAGGPDSARERGVVGFLTCGIETGGYERTLRRGVVHNLYVRPAYRGDGVGSRLLARGEAALVDAGADAVALEAMADNERARRFYRRNGYEPHRVELQKRVEDAKR